MIKRFILVFVLSAFVLADCSCDTESDKDKKSEAVKYKLGAIASILVAGAIGICTPILGRAIPILHPDGNIFFIIKAFAASVILATGFIHVLPDAFDNLTSLCLNEDPWGKFPFTGFVAMVAAIGTFMMDSFSISYLKKAQNQNDADEEENDSVDTNSAESQLLRHKVISKVLEFGILVHSIIIGISFGVFESLKTIRSLIAALTFHQFFESMGLNGCISQGAS